MFSTMSGWLRQAIMRPPRPGSVTASASLPQSLVPVAPMSQCAEIADEAFPREGLLLDLQPLAEDTAGLLHDVESRGGVEPLRPQHELEQQFPLGQAQSILEPSPNLRGREAVVA